MIKHSIVTARKPHVCDYCGCEIHKGERHEVQTNVRDGRLYRWRAHLHCQTLCSEIWDYVDPDEGMTGDEFCDAVRQLMSTFYCPFHCDEYDRDTQDCDRDFDADVCVKRFAKFMESRTLTLVHEPDCGLCWRMTATESEVGHA